MAKRARQIVVEETPVTAKDELETERELEQEAQKNLEIDAWLADFRARMTDQSAKILVEKYQDNEWMICKKYPLTSFDHEAVREEFGGGRYRAILYGADGRYVKDGRNYFQFANAIPKASTPRVENPLENPIVVMFLKAQETNQANMIQMMQSVIAGGGAAAGKSDMAQLISGLKELQGIAPKEKDPMSAVKDTLGMMKLFKEVNGDGDSKGGLLSDIKEFIEIWPSVKEQLATIRPAVPLPVGSTAGGAPNLPGPAPTAGPAIPVPERKPMDPLSKKIIELVPKYVDAGKRALGVESTDKEKGWGEILLDDFENEIMPVLLPVMQHKYGALAKTEDDVYDLVLRYAEDSEAREVIFKEITPLAPHREWVNRVINEAIRVSQNEIGATTTGGSAILDAVQSGSAQTGHASSGESGA